MSSLKRATPHALRRELQTARKAWALNSQDRLCAMCGHGAYITGHHIIPLRILKANNLPHTAWYDLRNYLPLCAEPAPKRCHARHELWVIRVPRKLLSPAVYEFADAHDLAWVLDREYPT